MALSRSRRAVFTLILFTLLASFGLILLEITARVFDPNGVSYYPNTAKFMDTMVLEEPVGYRNRPGLDGTFYGHPVKINSLGLRNSEVTPKQDSSEMRILMLGDSVIFGVGVAEASTIPRQLELMANNNAKEPAERSVSVINMGVVSYNTEQELIQFQQLGAGFEPDLVVLYYSRNDIEPKMWIFDKRSNPLVRIIERSYGLSTLISLWQTIKDTVDPQNSRIQLSAYREDSVSWQNVKKSLTSLAQAVEAAGARFVVMASGKGAEIPLLQSVASEANFPFCVINLFDDPRNSSIDPSTLFAKGAGKHFNHQGLNIQARAMYEALEELSVFARNADVGAHHYCPERAL